MIKAAIFDMYETLVTLFDGPVYLATQMAEDSGIPEDDFLALWRQTEDDRTLGKITIDEVIEGILKKYDRYTEEKVNRIMDKRIRYKKEVFDHLHPEIIPMMETLRLSEIRTGLISNCHSEEAKVIRESILFPYFDAVCLSYDEGIKKPDPRIYMKCLNKLELTADDCMYIGDGGSNELVAAKNAGLFPVQAVWYLKEGTLQPAKRMPEYIQAETPMAITMLIRTMNQSGK